MQKQGIVGSFKDGDKFEATAEDHFDDLIFGVKTEKIIASAKIISENDNFGMKSEMFSEKKLAVSLRNGIAYDNYEAKTIITYEDGTTDEITIYITIPEGVY